MTAKQQTSFDDLILETKDGEWGEGEEAHGHTLCEVVRGTDFANLHDANLELPRRWIPDHLVERKALRSGDILIETAGGTAKQSTGRTALLTDGFFRRHAEMPVLCSSFARHLRVDTTKVRADYLYYVLQALYRAGYMAVFNLQHTGVARFQFTSFRRKTSLALASEEAQPKIAAILSSYDDLIANNQRRIALLEGMAEEIYREWFVRMRFPGAAVTDALDAVPPGWQLESLEALGTFLNGYAFDPGEWFDFGLPIVKIKELNSGVGADTPRNPGEKLQERYRFGDGDVIFSWSGSLVVKIWDQGDAWLNQHLFKVTPKEALSRSFLYLSIKFSIPIFESLTTGATMQHIKRKELRFVKVRVPDPELMLRFNAQVEPMLSAALKLKQANRKLAATRDALLPRLISGKLKVDHLDIRLPPSMRAEAEAAEATA